MYASFFGLAHEPFSIAPDPRYLFMSERHREALAHLLYGVGGGGGFVLLSGEIGAGKTTVCRCFLEQVPPGCQVAYIFNPKLTVVELLQTVCDEFGVAVALPNSGVPTVKTYIDALNTHLLAAHAQGRYCVLVIDEAQNLSAEVLEQLRLLTNLETHERKLLQIILIGQPELRQMLASEGLEQLAQRVIARYHLGALSERETAAYVAHRLAVAGLSGPMPFDKAALKRLHALTGGVPRRINLLADRALLGAYGQGAARVSARVVNQAAHEVFDATAGGGASGLRSSPWLWSLGGLGLVALAAAAWMGRTPPGAPGVAAARVPAMASAAASAAVRPASLAAPRAALSAGPVTASAPAVAVAASGPRDLGQILADLPRDEQAVWRELAPAWGLTVTTDAPVCQSEQTQGLRCYRSVQATWAQLRQLDRPGVLVLRDEQGLARYVALAGLGQRQGVLRVGGQTVTVSLDALSPLWRGEFATLWRAPSAYAGLLEPGASGAAVDALATALAAFRDEPAPAPGQRLAGPLAARLAAFQRSQGLKADGVAGPTTFMQLNRVRGVVEPRLPAVPGEP
jgi:general secretion pathway protein A